ncbi:hypothetical protein [Cryptosporangium sp. NPDC051539]|uniref:hypothetical protein n=1 Tax=Cryptosporangium sp. NPDC051539 TaxID=3363962 RepID=UPI00379422AA
MGSPRVPEPSQQQIAEQAVSLAVENVRRFLHSYVADSDGWDEVRREVRQTARVGAPTLRDDVAAIDAVVIGRHAPGTLLRLVEGDGNWNLDREATDAGAADFLRELAGLVRSVLAEPG